MRKKPQVKVRMLGKKPIIFYLVKAYSVREVFNALKLKKYKNREIRVNSVKATLDTMLKDKDDVFIIPKIVAKECDKIKCKYCFVGD